MLQIEENAVPLPDNFQWGKEWRAVRIWKELRDDGDFIYAFCIRYYGPNDYGRKKADEIWIGREIKYISERDWDNNPKSKTYGQRVAKDAETVTEEIWDEKLGKYVPVETAINAIKEYDYKHKANDPDLVAQYKTLVGRLPAGRKTQLLFVYDSGGRTVNIDNPDDFWNHTVSELMAIESKKDSIFASTADKQKTKTDTEIEVQERPATPPRQPKGTK